MSNKKAMQGLCLCGGVRVEAELNQHLEACHCGMCRRWGGGPFLSVHAGSDVKIHGMGKYPDLWVIRLG